MTIRRFDTERRMLEELARRIFGSGGIGPDDRSELKALLKPKTERVTPEEMAEILRSTPGGVKAGTAAVAAEVLNRFKLRMSGYMEPQANHLLTDWIVRYRKES